MPGKTQIEINNTSEIMGLLAGTNVQNGTNKKRKGPITPLVRLNIRVSI